MHGVSNSALLGSLRFLRFIGHLQICEFLEMKLIIICMHICDSYTISKTLQGDISVLGSRISKKLKDQCTRGKNCAILSAFIANFPPSLDLPGGVCRPEQTETGSAPNRALASLKGMKWFQMTMMEWMKLPGAYRITKQT